MRIIMFMTLILASCAVTGSAYKGARVGQEETIPLPANPSELM